MELVEEKQGRIFIFSNELSPMKIRGIYYNTLSLHMPQVIPK